VLDDVHPELADHLGSVIGVRPAGRPAGLIPASGSRDKCASISGYIGQSRLGLPLATGGDEPVPTKVARVDAGTAVEHVGTIATE
jgi:hypothetical protein